MQFIYYLYKMLNNMSCQLCKNAEANQTGSHLFSAFLVESMLGKRNNEVGYFISASPDLDYRKDVGADPIKEDYILCRGCEQRLSYLEGYISQEFTQKIDKDNFQSNFLEEVVQNIRFKTPSRVNNSAFKLIIYSIFWRASLSKNHLFKSFNLPPEIMEQLRVALNNLLPPYQNFKVEMKRSDWLASLDKNNDVIPDYPFIIIKGDIGKDGNRNSVLVHPNFNQPYHLLLNEYLILLFPSPSNLAIRDDFFDLLKSHNGIEKAIVGKEEALKIIVFKSEEWDKIIEILKKALVKQKLDAIYRKLRIDFFILHKRVPTEDELNMLVDDYLSNQEPEL